MKSETKKRGRSFTKSYLMLNLIADLENKENEVEEDGEEEEKIEEEIYTELDKEVECREELQENYSQIIREEISNDYQLPHNCHSEEIYELVQTLRLPHPPRRYK